MPTYDAACEVCEAPREADEIWIRGDGRKEN